MVTINLTPAHRGRDSSTFTGRPQGKSVRDTLNISKCDSDREKYILTIPKGTTSFNPSFYLGLFFDSIKAMGGVDNFKQKYTLKVLDDNRKIYENLEMNIAECERQGRNEFEGKTGIDIY